jgi:lipid-A-disaccharide synthase
VTTFFLVAGEASGDFLGAQLIRALKKKVNAPTFIGVGGPQMISEGLENLFPYEELSLMGLVEILPKLRKLLRRIDETAALAKKVRPCTIVTIDSPGFNLRFIKRARAMGVQGSFVHYVAPQVWAWRPGRVHKIAHLVDHLLCLFPFEPPYFEKVGLATTFVGHPLTELDINKNPRFLNQHGIPETAQILTLLPGSRVGEITRLLPVFQETALLLKKRLSSLFLLIPTLPHLEAAIHTAFRDFPLPWRLLRSEDKIQGFLHSQAAFAASGTVTLELAFAGLPAVISYRLSPLTYFYAKHFVHVKYISLVNLLLQRPLLTELIQDNCTPKHLYEAVVPLFEDPEKRQQIQTGYGQALMQLYPEGYVSPSQAAATIIASKTA